MSLTLDATIGGSGSNSYQTADAVQAILDGVVNTALWDAIKRDDPRELLCVQATSMLEVLAYLGQKVSISQALQWPRYSVEDPDFGDCDSSIEGQGYVGPTAIYLSAATIPKRVLRAHAMLVLELARAGTTDVWGVDGTRDVAAKTVGPISTQFVAPEHRRTGLRRYPSVWREIYPLTRAARAQSVERA